MAYNTLQPISSGGTGATTASGARTNLGLGTSDTVTFGNLVLSAGGGLRTAQGAGNTALLQAYDVDGASYVTFATLTANNTPTFDLSASTTIGGNPIGSGDVTGPGSSTNTAFARFSGTTGKIIQDSSLLGDGSGNISGIASLTLNNAGSLRTSQSAGNTVLLQAYDVDGAAYVTFGTLTANNTPTFDLSASTTIGGNPIGSGDVTGPGSSTDRALAIFSGTGGKTIQNSAATLDSSSRLLLPAGTTSNVSLSLGGNVNTGVNSTGSSNVGIICSGTTRISCGTNTTVGVNGETIVGNSLTLKRTATAVSVSVSNTSDYLVTVTDNSSPRTITLPSGPNTGATYIIKDEAGTAGTANPITIVVSGGVKTIDGATSKVIDTNYGTLTVYYNGSNYFSIQGYFPNSSSMTLTSTDAGAAAAPVFDCYRNSASPAAADILGQHIFNGKDSGSAKQEYARYETRIIDPTAGAENGAWALYTTSAGTATKQIDALDTGCQIRGNNTNTSPPAGFIGERISSFLPQASAVSLTNTVPADVTSISLTAGIWDISALGLLLGTLTGNLFAISISAASATNGTSGDNRAVTPTVSTVNAESSLVVPSYRVTLSSTTTYYLVAQANFTVGTATAYGRISATRVG